MTFDQALLAVHMPYLPLDLTSYIALKAASEVDAVIWNDHNQAWCGLNKQSLKFKMGTNVMQNGIKQDEVRLEAV